MNSDTFNGLTVNFLHVYSGASYALQEINDRTSEGIDRAFTTARMVRSSAMEAWDSDRGKAARWIAGEIAAIAWLTTVAIAEITWLTVVAIVITTKQWYDAEVDRCSRVDESAAVIEAIDVTEEQAEEGTGEEAAGGKAIGPLVATVSVLALSKVSPNSRVLEKSKSSAKRVKKDGTHKAIR